MPLEQLEVVQVDFARFIAAMEPQLLVPIEAGHRHSDQIAMENASGG